MSNVATITCEDAIAFVCEAAWGFAEVSPAYKFVWVNPAYCAILNAPADLIIGTTFQTWTHTDDVSIDVDLAAKVSRGELPGYTLAKRYIQRGSTPQYPRIIWGMLSVAGKWNRETGEFAGYRVQFRPYQPETQRSPTATKLLGQINLPKIIQWTMENWKTALLIAALLSSLIFGSSEKLLNVLREVKKVQEHVDGPSSGSSSGPSPQQHTQ